MKHRKNESHRQGSRFGRQKSCSNVPVSKVEFFQCAILFAKHNYSWGHLGTLDIRSLADFYKSHRLVHHTIVQGRQ